MLGQVIAPLLGAAALLAALFGLGAGAPASIAIGGLVWAGVWFADRYRRQAPKRLTVTRPLPEDLETAGTRLVAIREATAVVQRADHRAHLTRIADLAGAMLEEATVDTVKRRHYRKALGHRLWHVEALAARIVDLERAGDPDPALMDRASELFARLQAAFEQARQRSHEADAEDLDIRLSVIEQEMDNELTPAGGARR